MTALEELELAFNTFVSQSTDDAANKNGELWDDHDETLKNAVYNYLASQGGHPSGHPVRRPK